MNATLTVDEGFAQQAKQMREIKACMPPKPFETLRRRVGQHNAAIAESFGPHLRGTDYLFGERLLDLADDIRKASV